MLEPSLYNAALQVLHRRPVAGGTVGQSHSQSDWSRGPGRNSDSGRVTLRAGAAVGAAVVAIGSPWYLRLFPTARALFREGRLITEASTFLTCPGVMPGAQT